jgi:hypothetical protein
MCALWDEKFHSDCVCEGEEYQQLLALAVSSQTQVAEATPHHSPLTKALATQTMQATQASAKLGRPMKA